ncbi:MAG TPA: DMT family transporter, partial [Afifellaceae bacterium]|nr:DMT family transporter [Afifellaceae bacterium]
QTIEASVAVIIASLLPLAVAFSSRLFFGEQLSWLGFAGLVIGFAGAVMIMSGRIASGNVDMTGIALMVTALLSLTAATLLLRDALPRGDVLMIVGLQMLVGSFVLLPFALVLETWEVNWGWRLAGAFTYTILVPGIAATVTWFWLVRRIGPTRAATYHFLNPFLGVAVAALVLNETVSLRDLAGVAIVAGGILAVQLSRRPKSVLPRQ